LNTRRKLVIALGAGAFTAPLGVFAQKQGKIWRIGYLDLGSRKSMVDSGRYAALIDGLRERGYVEGKDYVLDARYADGHADHLDRLAAELVRQKLDILLSTGTPSSHAAHRATTTIPIVVTATADPVGEGFAVSFARPGGNMTGMSTGNDDVSQKLVELLILAVPNMKGFAVINHQAVLTHPPLLLRVKAAANQAGKKVLPIGVRTPEDIERGFVTMAREHMDGLIIFGDTFLLQQRTQIAELALKHRLPSIYPQSQYAEAGGLLSYGADINDNFRRAGIFVGKILKGAKPGDIPFEQPTKFDMVVNMKTAKTLGIKIPNSILVQATKVIE
jgi:putative ABC transport system substrate-binding protein